MFERFTDGARNLMSRSNALAQEQRSPFIRRHHMLYALLADAQDRPGAIPALMLADADVDLDTTRAAVLASLQASEAPSDVDGRIAYSSGAKKAIELALREALSLGHNYIGCEHMLLAILRSADGPLATVIGSTNLNYGTAREFLRTYSPARERGRRGRSGPVVRRELRRLRRTEAVDQVFDNIDRRALGERAITTGDLLVALSETRGSHFATILDGVALPSPSVLAEAADKLVADGVPDGAPDPIRVDPRTGAVTIADPELAEKLKALPSDKIAETLRRLVNE